MAPRQKPGKSVQSVGTPPEFLTAVRQRLGIDDFNMDLAADASNAVCPYPFYYTEDDDALKQRWLGWGGWLWCNPPYANIEPWVEKACHESYDGAKIAMLVPASAGTNWWRAWVHNAAYVTLLSPRLTFVGHTNVYPKDLALLLYASYLQGGYCTWRWKV